MRRVAEQAQVTSDDLERAMFQEAQNAENGIKVRSIFKHMSVQPNV